MSNNTEDALERAEIELLLPWYATGKLDASDRARVEAFLAVHPDMKRQLALVREEQDQAIRGNEMLAGPSAGSLDRLMASVARESHRPLSLLAVRTRMADFFSAPTAGGVRWAAAAAGILLLLQAAVIGTLLVGRTTDDYQTASGKQTTARGPTLLVAFTDSATAPAITALLAEFDAQIVDGPKPGGMYRLRLAKAPTTETERQDLVRRLLARSDIVKLALIGTD